MPVHLTRHDAVAVLELDEPGKMNAMTEALGDALQARVAELVAQQGVRAVVLAGAGPAFCAGGDLGMLDRLRRVPFEDAKTHMIAFYQRYLSLLQLPVPVIAAVHGAAMGAGLCVATACDLMVVSRNARLAYNFVGLGLHPGMGASFFVPRRVGHTRATELLFTGRRFSGADAHAWGLATDVVDVIDGDGGAEVRAAAMAVATRIAQQGPQAVRMLKQTLAVDQALLMAALQREATAQAHSYGSDELAEGLLAVVQKRPPVFP
jgi:enoyl-CoA hydratase/carnithine racemase